MAVDDTKRPLHVPPKFVPYLETHHIYDLFYDMTVALIKNRPEDVLAFMRDELIEYKKRRSTQRRIVFIAPKHLDVESLASELSEETDAIVLSLSQVIKEQNLVKNDTEPFYKPETLAKATRKCLESKQYPVRGWILVGFPRNKEEAKALQKKGILPTHTLEFMHTPKDYKVDDLWNESLASWSFHQFRDMMIEYKRSAVELREVYKSTYKKIIIRGRKKERIVNECRMLLNKMQHTGAPMLPRVVLIGNRGSRRRTLGNMLSKRFNLVHVNIRALLARGGTMENSLGEQIRHADHIDVIHINISLKLLEDRLMEEDCLTHGWVLTDFPNDESDFKILDNLDTPPNRIIFLGASSSDCMNRTQDRCINMFSGEVMSFKNTTDNNRMQDQLAIHPEDCYTTVAIEHEVFSSEIQGMLEYCESRAAIIDATGPLNEVFERVENIIMNPQACRKTDRLEPSQSLYNQLSGILQ